MQDIAVRLALIDCALKAWETVYPSEKDRERYRKAAPMITSVRLQTRLLFAETEHGKAHGHVSPQLLTNVIREALERKNEVRR